MPRKRSRHIGGAVAAEKHERHPARDQLVGKRIDQFAGEIDVEDREIELLAPCRFARPRERLERPEHDASGRLQILLERHPEEELVFDDEDTRTFEICRHLHSKLKVTPRPYPFPSLLRPAARAAR